MAGLQQLLSDLGPHLLWSYLGSCLALKCFSLTPNRRGSQTGPMIPASGEGSNVESTPSPQSRSVTPSVRSLLVSKADWILPGPYILVPGKITTVATKLKPSPPW